MGNEVFNPWTAKLRAESMKEIDNTPNEETMVGNPDGSVSQWDPSVYYNKDFGDVKMKL